MNFFRSNNISAFHAIEDKGEKLRLFVALLFVFSLPYNLFYSSVILYTLIATTLLELKLTKIKAIPKQIWLFQLVYFLGLLGYGYSYHKGDASFMLERQLTIFIFPIILPLAFKIDIVKTRLILSTLVLTSFCAILYLFLDMFWEIYFRMELPFFKTVSSGTFFNHQFSKPLGIHAGYLSLYVSLAIFYVVQSFSRTSSLAAKTALSVILLVLFSGLFFLAARNAIIANFIVLLFVFPFIKFKNRPRYLVIVAVCLVVIFLVFRNVPYLNQRFSSELITDIKPVQHENFTNYNVAEPRVERWKGALDLIGRSPVIGYGTGDEIHMLKTEYAKRGLFISYLENFNAHNQYLSYLIKNGIIGLLIFLGAFYYYFKLAFKRKDFIYIAFLSLLVIGFYTENILDSNKGILFFGFFNTIFGYFSLSAEKEETI